ncbi:MAG: hypothetical protein ACT4PL_09720 [Phycisphaerales bacterium]
MIRSSLRLVAFAILPLLVAFFTGGCAKDRDVVLIGTTYASLKPPAAGTAGRGVLVVATPLGKGKGYAPVYTEVERDADSNPPSTRCLGDAFGPAFGIEVSPRPPWWRYVRGRWTLQTTGRASIVAAGTTVIVIGYLLEDQAHEVVVLAADQGSETSAVVYAEDSGDFDLLECSGDETKEVYVIIDGDGNMSDVKSVDDWTDLRKAVKCIKEYVKSLGVETYFGQGGTMIP